MHTVPISDAEREERDRIFWLDILKEEIEDLSLREIRNLIAYLRA